MKSWEQSMGHRSYQFTDIGVRKLRDRKGPGHGTQEKLVKGQSMGRKLRDKVGAGGGTQEEASQGTRRGAGQA
jgi:hypothetical protein